MVVVTDFFFCTKSLNHFSNTLRVISFNFSRHFLCVHLTELFCQNPLFKYIFFFYEKEINSSFDVEGLFTYKLYSLLTE